jgi:hypothetical protein
MKDINKFLEKAKDNGLQGLNYFPKSNSYIGEEMPNGQILRAGWHAWDEEGDNHCYGKKTPEEAINGLLKKLKKKK